MRSILLALLVATSLPAVALADSSDTLVGQVLREAPWLAPRADGSPQEFSLEPSDEDVQLYSQEENIPADSARQVLRERNEYLVTASVAMAVAGDSYGGAEFIAEAPQARIFVGDGRVADVEDRTLEELRKHPELDGAANRAVFASGATLRRLHEDQRLAREYFIGSSYESWRVAARPGSEKVLISIPRISSDDRQRILDNLDDSRGERFGFVPRAERISPSCTWDDCASEKIARGGLQLSGCTAGYVGRNSAGDEYVLSAGHCFPNPPSSGYHAGYHMSNIPSGGSTQGIKTDVSRAFILQSSPQNWSYANWIYHSTSAQRFQVEARYSPSWCKANCLGISIYKSGKVSHLELGKVTDPYVSTKDYGSEMFEFSNNTCRGDSGGPVYTFSEGYAMGITSYKIGSQYTDGGVSCGYDGGASHVVDAEKEIGVVVLEN